MYYFHIPIFMYCSFHVLCRERGARGHAGRSSMRGAPAWQERAGRMRQAGWGAWPGVLLGQLAMHSVHIACFWPGLTRYFSGVRFLNIVREPGS